MRPRQSTPREERAPRRHDGHRLRRHPPHQGLPRGAPGADQLDHPVERMDKAIERRCDVGPSRTTRPSSAFSAPPVIETTVGPRAAPWGYSPWPASPIRPPSGCLPPPPDQLAPLRKPAPYTKRRGATSTSPWRALGSDHDCPRARSDGPLSGALRWTGGCRPAPGPVNGDPPAERPGSGLQHRHRPLSWRGGLPAARTAPRAPPPSGDGSGASHRRMAVAGGGGRRQGAPGAIGRVSLRDRSPRRLPGRKPRGRQGGVSTAPQIEATWRLAELLAGPRSSPPAPDSATGVAGHAIGDRDVAGTVLPSSAGPGPVSVTTDPPARPRDRRDRGRDHRVGTGERHPAQGSRPRRNP